MQPKQQLVRVTKQHAKSQPGRLQQDELSRRTGTTTADACTQAAVITETSLPGTPHVQLHIREYW